MDRHQFIRQQIIGNEIENEALKILKKKKNLRIIEAKNLKLNDIQNIVSNFNNLMIQTTDNKKFSRNNFIIASKKKPNKG